MNQDSVSQQAGHHNAQLDASRLRIIEGATWKRQRTIQVMPAGAMIAARVAHSHASLIYPPNQGAHKMLALGLEVGDAYNRAIEAILAHPDLSTWEYVLTLEADNVPPPDGLLRLIKRMEEHPEFACIGGLYWTKGPAGQPQIWGDPKDPVMNFRPQVPVPGELVECNGTGMGFNLWRLSMFKDPNLRKPWFVTLAGATGSATQDLYFWSDAHPKGYRCAIDCGVLVGHHDAEGKFGVPDFTW